MAQLTTKRDRVLNTVLAQATIQSDIDQIKRLNFGYSDRVKVYLNGQLLYSGNKAFRARDYRFLGTIGFLNNLFLPLKKGDNNLVIAVSETFGGWGLQAKFSDIDSISLPNKD